MSPEVLDESKDLKIIKMQRDNVSLITAERHRFLLF